MRGSGLIGSVLGAVFCLLIGLPASAQSHGPPSFLYPAPDNGRSMMFGGAKDDNFWSWFEIGPDVCGGIEDARIFALVGGRRVAVPCASFVHARVAPGRHPKNWGRARDPIRARAVSVTLQMEPPALVTLDEGRDRNDRRVKEVGRILIGAGNCEDLVAGYRLCRAPGWPDTQTLIVHPTVWLRDGLPLHMACDLVDEVQYCRLQDSSANGPGQVIIDVSLAGLSAEALALMEPLYITASEVVVGWSANRVRQ
ncbi:MAG: hypothetical protein AAFR46_15415 [Pseudomonadota bacterium]